MNAASVLLADTDNWDHMEGWGGGWMWLWGVAMMTLSVVLVVWVVRANVTTSRSSEMPGRDPAHQALEILAERYARGDITTDEYRERASELR